jgi:hypothetical protein
MSAIFKEADPSIVDDNPAADLPRTDFARRLYASSGTLASGNVDDRRPLRSGSLPGAIGIPTPPADRAAVYRSLIRPQINELNVKPIGQLANDAGIGELSGNARVNWRGAGDLQPRPGDDLQTMIDNINRQKAARRWQRP